MENGQLKEKWWRYLVYMVVKLVRTSFKQYFVKIHLKSSAYYRDESTFNSSEMTFEINTLFAKFRQEALIKLTENGKSGNLCNIHVGLYIASP